MKTLQNILMGLIIITSFFACSDESLNPLPDVANRVGLVKTEIIAPSGSVINLNTDEPVIKIDVAAPQDNVDSFTIMGKISPFVTNPNLLDYGDYVVIKTTTTIPSTLTITANELATAFGMLPSDFAGGTANLKRFRYIATSVSDGITVNLDNVLGAGFSADDNPDGITSGLTAAYQEKPAGGLGLVLRYH